MPPQIKIEYTRAAARMLSEKSRGFISKKAAKPRRQLMLFLGRRCRNLRGTRGLGVSFADANHELIRDFDAHGFLSSTEGKAVFQKDRLPRVGHERTHGRKVNIGCAVAGFHALAYESGITSHNSPV